MRKIVILMMCAVLLLGYTQVFALEQSGLQWSVSVPAWVEYGGKPYSITTTVTNPTESDLPFAVSAKQLFEGGSDRSTEKEFSGGEISNEVGDGKGLSWDWRGTVPPGETFSLIVRTHSGLGHGSYRVFLLTDLVTVPGTVIAETWLLHVAPLATLVPIVTDTPTMPSPPTSTSTEIVVPATETQIPTAVMSTYTPWPTNTSIPTVTPLPSGTNTPVSTASPTATNTHTLTPLPTNTQRPTLTSEPTHIPPSPTPRFVFVEVTSAPSLTPFPTLYFEYMASSTPTASVVATQAVITSSPVPTKVFVDNPGEQTNPKVVFLACLALIGLVLMVGAFFILRKVFNNKTQE